MAESTCCRRLAWDSEFFGVRIGRFLPTQPSARQFSEAETWCVEHDIHCLYFLCDADAQEGIRLAEAYRYALVDVRVTLSIALDASRNDISAPPGPSFVRRWRSEDLPVLRTLAAKSFTASRFYNDGHFSPERVGRMYEVWLEKSCGRDSSTVLVAEADGRPTGLVTCDFPDEDCGQIGLFAISDEVRGSGVARRLLLAGVDIFRERGRNAIEVVTQGRNIGAQRLYQACGFSTRAVQLWYHKWFSAGAVHA
jgi:ribosomal protein S18 acetylase RimI-like enzyme